MAPCPFCSGRIAHDGRCPLDISVYANVRTKGNNASLPALARRIPGHPVHYYLKASGGYWLYQLTDTTSVFVAVFATRRDLDQFMDGIL